MSPTFWTRLGHDPDTREHLAAEWQDLIFPEDLELAKENVARHIKNPDHPYDQLVRYKTSDRGTVTVRCRGMAIRKNGKPVRLLGCHTLVSDTREMILDSELNQLLELSNEAIYAWSPVRGVRRWNRGAARLYGVEGVIATGRNPNKITQAIYPEPFEDILEQLKCGEDWSGEVERRSHDGTTVFTDTRLQAMETRAEDVLILEIDRDIGIEKAAHARQAFLTRELNHRVKNLFAVMRGLVNMSSRGETEIAEFADKLSGRVDALAAAHLLSLDANKISNQGLANLINDVLSPYVGSGADVSMSGPDIRLHGQNSTPLGLIFHELATNAAKYGACSGRGGTVEINWTVEDHGAPELDLNIRWSETCPADHAMPQKTDHVGFGTQLIQSSAAQLGGSLRREFRPNGLDVSLELKILAVADDDVEYQA